MQDLVNLDRLIRVEQHADHPFGYVQSRESLLHKLAQLSSTRCIVSPLGNEVEKRHLCSGIEKDMQRSGIKCAVRHFNLYLKEMYALQDDIYIPFLVTVDSQTGKDGTVIVRKCHRPEQVRVLAQEAPQVLHLLIDGHLPWEEVAKIW